MRHFKRKFLLALATACFVGSTALAQQTDLVSTGSVPLIHYTDLLYPPDDPDDWFDLAAIYAVPEFDLKCVILDQGEKQNDRAGTTPIAMLNQISGRSVPSAIGLSQKLRSPADKGVDQPAEFQQGVETILRLLRETTAPVSISVVGSARDLATAFNREPDLLRQKVRRVYVFAGDAQDPKFVEWNVHMEPLAFAALMLSGLPISWIPCFDQGDMRNGGNASYWVTSQSQLLARAPEPLLQYFIAATQHDATSHPLEFVREPVDQARKKRLFDVTRNMWGGALLSLIAGRRGVEQDGRYSFQPGPAASVEAPAQSEIIGFREVQATFSDAGIVNYDSPEAGNKLLRFHINEKDRKRYGAAMTEATAELLARFRVKEPAPWAK